MESEKPQELGCIGAGVPAKKLPEDPYQSTAQGINMYVSIRFYKIL